MNVIVLDAELDRIVRAQHHDPFAVLGRHLVDGQTVIRAFIPDATGVTVAEGSRPLSRIPGTDFFEWRGDGAGLPDHYRLLWRDGGHHEHVAHDPYTYSPPNQRP